MKKLLTTFIWGICLLLVTSCSKDEQVMTGNISGFVTDYTNANSGIAGATVTLNNVGRTKTTGSDGRYEFTNLEPGTYTISVAANNYQSTTKQVTVYAGQNATCDFQLELASTSVDISPLNLSFGQDVEQLSFNIKNNSNQALTYSISNTPDFVEVSPSSGTVAAKATQAVTIRIINRSSITTNRNGQLTVNVGNNSYNISLSVEPYKTEAVSVDIYPQSLSFDKDTEQLTFAITSNNTYALDFKISSNLDILTVAPTTGTIASKAKNTITVTVNNRKSVDENRTGQLTIEINGDTYAVPVSVAKYEEGNSQGGTKINPDDVLNGLYTYFKFDNELTDLTDTGLTTVATGTSFVESFDGSSALSIPGNSSSTLSIPDGLIDKSRMTISFWVKDLYDGHIFHAVRNYDNKSAFLLAMVDGKLKFVVTRYHIGYQYKNMPSFTHNTLSGWHMVTLVSDFSNTSYSTITTRLYVDGIYTDIVTEDDNVFSESETGANKNYNACMKFVMGGELSESNTPNLNATRITIDNLRVYHRILSEDEIKTIYNIEKK